MERLHVADFTPVPSEDADSWRKITFTPTMAVPRYWNGHVDVLPSAVSPLDDSV
jgi:hypothetical protein